MSAGNVCDPNIAMDQWIEAKDFDVVAGASIAAYPIQVAKYAHTDIKQ